MNKGNIIIGKVIYFITIIDNETCNISNLVRTEENISETLDKEFGNFNYSIVTSFNKDIDNINFQQCGTTKDGKKSFSILCVADKKIN